MPKPSKRITAIVPSGKDGWEVHFAAWNRKQAGEDIIVLSVGDHDFDTPSETIEACVTAVRESNHHYTPLPGLPRLLSRTWLPIVNACRWGERSRRCLPVVSRSSSSPDGSGKLAWRSTSV